MKTQTLVPALALAAALLAPPHAEADGRHRSAGGRGYSAHGDYGHGQSHGSYGQHSSHGYRNGYGYHSYGYRSYRPYYRGPRYYAPPPAYYGYGSGGCYGDYGYGYYPPPPPPRYYRPGFRFGVWLGF